MKFAPVFFVLLWSTGFVGAKYGLPYADPFIFLGIRVFIAATLLYAFAFLTKAKMRLTKSELKLSAVVGATLHFAYLGGVFFGISKGVPAGIAATITSLQPIVVSILGVRVLNEAVTKRQLVGLLFGFLGVLIVLSPAFKSTSTMSAIGIISVFVALFGSTSATLVQKRAGGSVPMISGTAFQYVIAGALFISAATVTQGFQVTWSGKFIFALTWLVLALSVGAVLLLLSLLKRGSASQVSSLFYLVPPATAIEAFFLFDEKLTAQDFFGISLTALGVYLVIKKKQVR